MASLSELFQHSENLPRIVELDLAAIAPNPDQPRKVFDEEKLAELAASIETGGLIHPITVKSTGDGRYMIIAGERRFRAFSRLGRATIPAIISGGNIDELALIENVQRENLHPIDEFEAVSRLVEKHAYTHEEAGKVLGKGRVSITELLSLSAISPLIRAEARNRNGVTKSFLIELAREKRPDAQRALWQGSKDGPRVRDARKVRNATSESKPADPVETARAAVKCLTRAIDALIRSGHPKAERLKTLSENIADALAS